MSSENQEPNQDDVVDLEAYFAAQRPVPHGKKYRIRIDKQFYVVHVAELTGRQILELAGKTPEKLEPFALTRFYEDRLVGEKAAASVSH